VGKAIYNSKQLYPYAEVSLLRSAWPGALVPPDYLSQNFLIDEINRFSMGKDEVQ